MAYVPPITPNELLNPKSDESLCPVSSFPTLIYSQVIGSVNTMLSMIYPVDYAQSSARKNVSSIAFAGTVVGQLVFGVLSDYFSRKWSLMISTVILIIFAALGAGSYGTGGSIGGLFAALTAFRFFLGIGIGGEYPAGSVACAESTGELKNGHRNRWFISKFYLVFVYVKGHII
jgi:MFS family permease